MSGPQSQYTVDAERQLREAQLVIATAAIAGAVEAALAVRRAQLAR